jgi:hypothetical protein
MQEITIKCPDEFSPEQVEFIKKSAMLQIEAEMRKELKVPQEAIDACEAKISSVKEAMGIKTKVEEVKEPIKDSEIL